MTELPCIEVKGHVCKILGVCHADSVGKYIDIPRGGILGYHDIDKPLPNFIRVINARRSNFRYKYDGERIHDRY